MVNLKNKLIFTLFLLLLILISSCGGKKETTDNLADLRTGTQGITMSFLPNNPPAIIHAESNGENSFGVILELRNRGAFPQPDDKIRGPPGKVYLSGYDRNIITIEPKDNSDDLSTRALEGKNIISQNGGVDIVSFDGSVAYSTLNIDKYDLIMLATACYDYETIAGPTVCIDPDPYSTIYPNEKKVCEVKDLTLSSQGGPIAVTQIIEEAFSDKTQFRITIKNVGTGDVFRSENFDKCNPVGQNKLQREDINKVYLEEVKIADTNLECKPFVEDPIMDTQGVIRLLNGEGSIICDLNQETYSNYEESKTPFTTPLTIKLSYKYRDTIQTNVQIKREPPSDGTAP
ncbi:hypothetical protein CMO83_02635 [Candidatus Woesearchaeota archaeon]|nr:hypothetical protein [Candidatus Woesearchaeota archaeon]|tara:strand:+ start:1231 stop:2265 length:1035 start_codon:yes stop_codon:yes gene_type:complete